MQLLLAEDDPVLGRAIQAGLSHDGVIVDWKRRGEDVLASFDRHVHEALALDLGLPDIDGFEILHRLRQIDPGVPIVVITARASVEERIRGLDFGADDYLTKPFELVELLARLRAVQRRLGRAAAQVVQLGQVSLDVRSHAVMVRRHRIVLDAREFLVLRLLMQSHADLTALQVAEHLQDLGDDVNEAAAERFIDTIHRKLGIAPMRGQGKWRCASARTLH